MPTFKTSEGISRNRQNEIANGDIEMAAEDEIHRDENEPRAGDECAETRPDDEDGHPDRKFDHADDRHKRCG